MRTAPRVRTVDNPCVRDRCVHRTRLRRGAKRRPDMRVATPTSVCLRCRRTRCRHAAVSHRMVAIAVVAGRMPPWRGRSCTHALSHTITSPRVYDCVAVRGFDAPPWGGRSRTRALSHTVAAVRMLVVAIPATPGLDMPPWRARSCARALTSAIAGAGRRSAGRGLDGQQVDVQEAGLARAGRRTCGAPRARPRAGAIATHERATADCVAKKVTAGATATATDCEGRAPWRKPRTKTGAGSSERGDSCDRTRGLW